MKRRDFIKSAFGITVYAYIPAIRAESPKVESPKVEQYLTNKKPKKLIREGGWEEVSLSLNDYMRITNWKLSKEIHNGMLTRDLVTIDFEFCKPFNDLFNKIVSASLYFPDKHGYLESFVKIIDYEITTYENIVSGTMLAEVVKYNYIKG